MAKHWQSRNLQFLCMSWFRLRAWLSSMHLYTAKQYGKASISDIADDILKEMLSLVSDADGFEVISQPTTTYIWDYHRFRCVSIVLDTEAAVEFECCTEGDLDKIVFNVPVRGIMFLRDRSRV